MVQGFARSALVVVGAWNASAQTAAPRPDHLRFAYDPTPDPVIEKMFEMARLTQKDVVFDLGCGDGRIVAKAAEKFGCRAIGVDLNPIRISECLERVKQHKLEKLVDQGTLEFRYGNALTVPDLGEATVIFLYMVPEFMNEFKKVALKRLKPGTRIVSYFYRWIDKDWQPDQIVHIDHEGRPTPIFLWTVKP